MLTRDYICRHPEPDDFFRIFNGGTHPVLRAALRQRLEQIHGDVNSQRVETSDNASAAFRCAATYTGAAGVCAVPSTYALSHGIGIITRDYQAGLGPVLTIPGGIGELFGACFFYRALQTWKQAYAAARDARAASHELRVVEAYMRHPAVALPAARGADAV